MLGLELALRLGDALQGAGLLEDDGGLGGGLELAAEAPLELELVCLVGQLGKTVDLDLLAEDQQFLFL